MTKKKKGGGCTPALPEKGKKGAWRLRPQKGKKKEWRF